MRRLLRALAGASAAGGVVLLALLGGLALHDRAAPRPVDWLAAAGLQPQYRTVAGHRVRFVRSGRGPALLLVHGFGSSLYTWKDVIPRLTPDHDVIALDLPGFGMSEQPADLVADDLPASVLGLLDALGLKRAALVGNSLGGATAALAAATRPSVVSALVLVDSAGFNMSPEQQPTFVRVAMSPAGPFLALLPGKRLFVERALCDVFQDPRRVDDERVAEYLQAALRPGGFAAVRSLGASLEGRHGAVQEALARVSAPTLVVWGREDRWIPIADSELFAAAIAGARTVVMEDCGHMPQEERPAEFVAVLRRFLAEAEASAQPAAAPAQSAAARPLSAP